ncbi:ATP-binding cassette domain-containing protein [Salinimonas sp. HHU 13199]|uniref:ATP-binding cassette domain-containing protein n=1 Tax=Salinimonas profundi TaxID=2729140 RepID=A0ABR8LKE7_9ALTE|nr:ATP-binding cassette domain-containing protein [Salinimonas profundi]MBD3585561.1 ATP-binding cassette domain-containing protein [Salinimonas profundi]
MSHQSNLHASSVAELAVDIKNLVYSYSKSAPPVISVKKWQLPKCEHVFVSGASGSGKSTLLNLLTGTLQPDSGSITLFNTDFGALSARQKDAFRAQHIGVVFQQFNLIDYLTVLENLTAAAYFAKNTSLDIEARARQLLEKLQLPSSVLQQRADTLSVGQQQRVAIARALINAPHLVIVDEPTSALDADARDKFMQLLIEATSDSAVIFVSHDKSLAQYFDTQIDMASLNQANEGQV